MCKMAICIKIGPDAERLKLAHFAVAKKNLQEWDTCGVGGAEGASP